MDLRGWNILDEERAILWREYPFRKGAWATTFVFRGEDGLVVVSPGSGLEAADYDVLSKFGEVRALVANNAFHYVGQAPWRARFPRAESYAAPSAVARLAKKASAPFRPIGDLALSSHARAHALPGYKNGELLFSIDTKNGSAWYTGDLLTNIQRTPGPPFSWLFKLTDSGPGFRLFKLGVMVFVNDKRALASHMTKLLAEDPPGVIVPGHGPALTADVASQAKAQLAKL